jgi:hypothetical protein
LNVLGVGQRLQVLHQLVLKGTQELIEQNEQLLKRIETLEKAQATIKS